MRLFSHQDAFLVVGLASAIVVMFARPIHFLLAAARQIEESYGLGLVPALLILIVVILAHQRVKRQETQARAAATHQMHERLQELEQVAAFGEGLARAIDVDALREVIARHLPRLAGDRDAWVLRRGGDKWERLMGDPFQGQPPGGESVESFAARVLAAAGPAAGARCWVDGQACLPLIVGDSVVGVLGVVVGREEIDDNRARVLGASAAALAVAIRNDQLFREIRDNSMYDGLTGCFNHTYAMEALEVELRRAHRSQRPLSIMMFDLDHFKNVNDRYGHLCGDAVLASVGQRLKELLRHTDVKCRYGGEEFLVLLPDTPLRGATHVAELLRREIAETPVRWDTASVSITASFGVAAGARGELDASAVIARADAALYRAKRDGRNCVRAEETTGAEPGGDDARAVPVAVPSPPPDATGRADEKHESR